MLSVLTRQRPDQRKGSEHPQGAVHWFLLFWFGLIFAQAMVYRFVSQGPQRYATEAQSGSSSGILSSVSPFLKPTLTPAVILLVFLALMALHGGLHWLALFRGITSSQALGLCCDPAPLHFLHRYRRRS